MPLYFIVHGMVILRLSCVFLKIEVPTTFTTLAEWGKHGHHLHQWAPLLGTLPNMASTISIVLSTGAAIDRVYTRRLLNQNCDWGASRHAGEASMHEGREHRNHPRGLVGCHPPKLDVLCPFPTTDNGNRHVLAALDYFTKLPEVHAVPLQSAATTAVVWNVLWVQGSWGTMQWAQDVHWSVPAYGG